jgi:uncharacterized membrane protein YbhN (UPF0104 family)
VLLRLCVGLLASGLLVGALLSKAPPDQILLAIGRCRPGWLLVAAAAIGLSFTIRVKRWTVLLRRTGVDVRFRDAAVPLMGSVALNNLLPFRAGDAIRLIALHSFTGAVAPRQIAAFALERLADFHVLVAIVFVTAALWPPEALGTGLALAREAAAVVALAAPIGLLAAPAAVRSVIAWIERLAPGVLAPRGGAVNAYDDLQALARPGLLIRVGLLSYAAWLAEGCAFVAVAQAFGLAAPWRTGALAVGLATLATAIPSLPGYVGPFDFFAAAAATAYGAPPADAVAYAIVVHALLWTLGTVAGWRLLSAAARIGVVRGPSPAAAGPAPPGRG